MLQYEKKNGILLVRLSGELDHHCAAAIREELDALIDRSDARRLVFDLSGLTFMDSSGIGVMLGRYRQLARRGGTLAVRGASPQVDRIFRMSGLYQVIEKCR